MAITYSVQSGSLPTGVSLNSSTGALTGTLLSLSNPPTWNTAAGSLGAYSVGNSVSKTFSATPVTPATIATYTLVYTRNGNYSSIPWGLTFSGTTGVLSGTVAALLLPLDSGATPSNLRPTWNTAAGSLGTINTSFASSGLAVSASAVSGHTLLGYSVISGYLPLGLIMNGSTGAITGTAQSLNYENPGKAIDVFTPVPTWNTAPGLLANLNEYQSYSTTLSASSNISGKTIAAYYVISGALANGLFLNSSTGAISGTASEVITGDAYYNTANPPLWRSATGTWSNNATTITVTSVANLMVGLYLYGQATIPAGTSITAINGLVLTISQNTTGSGSAATIYFGITTITSTGTWSNNSNTMTIANASNIISGMNVYATGVPTGTTISSINGSTLTLSQNTTAAGSSASVSFAITNTPKSYSLTSATSINITTLMPHAQNSRTISNIFAIVPQSSQYNGLPPGLYLNPTTGALTGTTPVINVTTTGSWANASKTITVASATNIIPGLFVYGPASIPAGTTVVSVSGTTITTSANSTALGSAGTSISFGYVSGGTSVTFNTTLVAYDSAGSMSSQPFTFVLN